MKVIACVLLFVTLCSCEVEFESRARNFSIELLHFTQLEKDGHVVISPFGVWTLMTGLTIGATGNSLYELRRAFVLPAESRDVIKGYNVLTAKVLSKSKDVSVHVNNFVFLDKTFNIRSEFERNIKDGFHAIVNRLNFSDPDLAAKTANDFIMDSGGKVSNVLQSKDFAESRMILTNVISFKGLWSFPFNVSDTKVEEFYDEKGNVIGEVKMMYQKAMIPFSNMQEMNAYVIELPYGSDNKYSMLLLLPYARIKATQMYMKLQDIGIKDIFARLAADSEQFGDDEIDVKLPRFKISTNVVLNKPLNDMGVYDIFSPKDASFEGVSKTDQLYVSAIVHKAEIEVTESGTVASAASTAYFADRITPPNFYANRPFVYFVIEKSTTTILFSGIYSKPNVF